MVSVWQDDSKQRNEAREHLSTASNSPQATPLRHDRSYSPGHETPSSSPDSSSKERPTRQAAANLCLGIQHENHRQKMERNLGI